MERPNHNRVVVTGMGAVAAIGRDHTSLSESRALAFLDEARGVAAEIDTSDIDVAAPPSL